MVVAMLENRDMAGEPLSEATWKRYDKYRNICRLTISENCYGGV
jgi:hypothetical protein